ncbi:MAG: sensor histidine kinase [Roseimicrobium sp.]
MMKTDLPAYTKSYLAALGRHLKQDADADLKPAQRLGLRAIKLGLETLELARIHEEALIALVLPHFSPDTSDGMVRRAGVFFAEVITPIEQTHRGAQEANAHLKVMVETLTKRTAELDASNHKLKREIAQRREAETSHRTSEETTSKLLAKSRQMQEALRHLSRQLLSAQEEERRKISRELHDVIAQTLAGIDFQLASLKTVSAAGTTDLKKKIAVTQRLVKKSVDIVHRFARDLRPTSLDDLGLNPALRSLFKRYTEETGIAVKFETCDDTEAVDDAVRTVFYRVAQEALTNVARHAQASSATVSISKLGNLIRMEIKDNGKGFDVNGASRDAKNNHLGLLGMKERVEMVGGVFLVESAPNNPTAVRVDIPLGGPLQKPKKKPGRAATSAPP